MRSSMHAFGVGVMALTLVSHAPIATAHSSNTSMPTTHCHFTMGPLAGQTKDLVLRQPSLVGATCADGAGSFGKIVSDSPPGNTIAAHKAASPCQSTASPNTGPNAADPKCKELIDATSKKLPVANVSTINKAMSGITLDDKKNRLSASDVSALCQFTTGPRAGQTQDQDPQPPLPVGTPCQDNAGSFGRVVPVPHGAP